MIKDLVSIIVPIYNEEESIQELVQSVHEVMKNTNYSYELILINDGSVDHSWEVITHLSSIYIHLKGIDLVGNYGQTIALRAGIEKAQGSIIVAMDGDLQHNPAYIPSFLEKIEEGYDMVGGAKEKRPEGFFKSLLSSFAHSIICKISGVNLQYFGATFKVYKSYLLKNTNLLGDSHRFLGALVIRKGVRYIELPIEIKERKYGKSNYHLSKIFLVILDLIFLKFFISYINKPFRFFGTVGAVTLLSGLFGCVYMVAGSLFSDINIKENYIAEFLFSIFLILIGALFLSFGVIAEIGVYNYFLKGNKSPYTIRELIQTPKLNSTFLNKEELFSIEKSVS
jgi:glycosyltransferase involved in cell wall biosynthesis